MTRWKYAKIAKERRYCESCRRRLRKDEPFLCDLCFAEIMHAEGWDSPKEEDEE